MRGRWSTAALLTVALWGCGTTRTEGPTRPEAPRRSGVVLENLDRTVRPQDDFYRFVNGAWLKRTTIPPSRSNYGTFTLLADKAARDVRAIIEEAAARKGAGSAEARKVADLYRSYMDTERRTALGVRPLARLHEEIDAIRDLRGLAAWFGRATRLGIGVPVRFDIDADDKAPSRYAVYISQGGLGLPDRDYYVTQNARYGAIRAKYEAHIGRLMQLAGLASDATDAAAQAKAIVALESRLAAGQWTQVQRRNRDKTYNPTTVAALAAAAPGVDWPAVTAGAGVGGQTTLVVREPSYLPVLAQAVREVPLTTWKTYLRWSLLREAATLLTPALDAEHFAFYGTVLAGVPKQRPNWERAVDLVNMVLGEAVGQLYVARHFEPRAKARMVALVERLRAAFRDALEHLPWLSAETRAQALDKLKKFRAKVGYPDRWKDYSKLAIAPDALAENVLRWSEWQWQDRLDKLGGPMDREEWFMTPQTVNAYYNPPMNEIVFPAAILQPPFFDLDADDAVNYGGIGAVIGHEMGHGFDDQGAKSDGDGVLRNWWTKKDLEEFRERTRKLVDQAAAFEVLGDKLNGKLTLGENIGDLGGVTIAYRAYRLSLEGREAPTLDGFTGDQRFFIGWAQCWPRLYRDEELRRRLVTDPHAPSHFRANAPLRNTPEFQRAFGAKPGDAMWLPEADRVKIW